MTTSNRIRKEGVSMDPESLPQRQVESLEAIEERLEYVADVLLWIGELFAEQRGHRVISAGAPKPPAEPHWRSGAVE